MEKVAGDKMLKIIKNIAEKCCNFVNILLN